MNATSTFVSAQRTLANFKSETIKYQLRNDGARLSIEVGGHEFVTVTLSERVYRDGLSEEEQGKPGVETNWRAVGDVSPERAGECAKAMTFASAVALAVAFVLHG